MNTKKYVITMFLIVVGILMILLYQHYMIHDEISKIHAQLNSISRELKADNIQ